MLWSRKQVAPFRQGLYWSQGFVESVDISEKISVNFVGAKMSPLLVTSKSPDCVVLGLMSPLLGLRESSEVNVVDTISPTDVSPSERVVVVVLTSPLEIMPKSPDVVECVMTSPLAVWIMTPEAVVSTVSAVTVMDSVLRSLLAVSLTGAF